MFQVDFNCRATCRPHTSVPSDESRRCAEFSVSAQSVGREGLPAKSTLPVVSDLYDAIARQFNYLCCDLPLWWTTLNMFVPNSWTRVVCFLMILQVSPIVFSVLSYR